MTPRNARCDDKDNKDRFLESSESFCEIIYITILTNMYSLVVINKQSSCHENVFVKSVTILRDLRLTPLCQ